MSQFTARFLIGAAALIAFVLIVLVPAPRSAPDGTPGRFSLLQVGVMRFADDRIQAAWMDSQDGLNAGIHDTDGSCRTQQKLKAISERLSADAGTIDRFRPMGLPTRAAQYARESQTVSDRAKEFAEASENCQP